MTPEFAIYRQLFIECLNHHSDTYDYLPKAGTKYPFIYIGNSSDDDGETKADVTGTVNQTIHIYAERTQRNTLEGIKNNLVKSIRDLNEAFDYSIILTNLQTRNLNDNTDVKPLIHAIIDVSFLYS